MKIPEHWEELPSSWASLPLVSSSDAKRTEAAPEGSGSAALTVPNCSLGPRVLQKHLPEGSFSSITLLALSVEGKPCSNLPKARQERDRRLSQACRIFSSLVQASSPYTEWRGPPCDTSLMCRWLGSFPFLCIFTWEEKQASLESYLLDFESLRVVGWPWAASRGSHPPVWGFSWGAAVFQSGCCRVHQPDGFPPPFQRKAWRTECGVAMGWLGSEQDAGAAGSGLILWLVLWLLCPSHLEGVTVLFL